MSRLKKHYIVYETTNKINGMTYIGCHGTYNLEDGYIGAGICSQAYAESVQDRKNSSFIDAVCEFGYKNFHTRIIKNFSTRKEAAWLERSLVNSEFIALDSSYNKSIGGAMPDSIRRKSIDEQEMYDLYMDGMEMTKVAKHFGVGVGVIRGRLKGWNILDRKQKPEFDSIQIYKLYMSGISMKDIADQLYTTKSVIQGRLSKMDTSLRKTKYTIDIDQIKDLYVYGMTYNEISRLFDVSMGVISRIINKSDVSRRNDFDVDRAYNMYVSGMTYVEVSKTLGVSAYVVREKVKDMDLSRRVNKNKLSPVKKRVMRWFVEHYDHYQDLYSRGKITKQGINDACPWDMARYGLTKEFTQEKEVA